MKIARGLSALFFLSICVTAARAEMIGHFEIGDCSDEGCEVLAPGTGEVMEWRLTKKELVVANKAYDTLVAADKRLEARGFVDVARVAFAYSTQDQLTPDGWISQVVIDVFLRRAHGNSFSEINEAMWSTGPYPWWPIADRGPQEFHPTTGVKLSVSSVKSRAQSLPDCFKNGDPVQDCQPVRYNKWTGCLLSAEQQRAYATDVGEWRTWDQADLPMLPGKEAESQLDLSTAKVTERAPKQAEAPKKSADNPAGREACGY
jgi:hypothetical protein